MRKFWTLTKLQLLSLFGINKIRHQKAGDDKKKGQRGLMVLCVMVFALLYMSVMYSMMLAAALGPMGQLPLMLGLMAMAASALTLVFSMFEAKSILYTFGDYDMIMSWPVSPRAVVASRVANMYLTNTAYGLLLLLPAGIIYAMYAAPPLWYYPLMLLGVLLMPCVPTLIGALLGTVMTVLTARMKKASIWNTVGQFVLMIVLVGGIMWLNMGMADIGEEMALNLGAAVVYYPPALWMQRAAAGGDMLSLLWLLLVSLGAMAVMVLLFSRVFEGVHRLVSDLPHGKAFSMGSQRVSRRVGALYRQEWKRYMSYSLYVTNTAFGYVMMLALGIAAVAVQNESFRAALADPFIQRLLIAVPLAVGMIAAMSATTGSAISMEGKQFWIVRTMPVPAKDLFISKILVSMTLAVPSILLTGTLLGIGLRMGAAMWPWLYITPLVCALFSAVFGLSVNLALPKLDWTNETEVVKQSGAMAAAMFGGMGCMLLPTALVAIFGMYWLLPLATLVLLIITAIIWKGLLKRGEKRLGAL